MLHSALFGKILVLDVDESVNTTANKKASGGIGRERESISKVDRIQQQKSRAVLRITLRTNGHRETFASLLPSSILLVMSHHQIKLSSILETT